MPDIRTLIEAVVVTLLLAVITAQMLKPGPTVLPTDVVAALDIAPATDAVAVPDNRVRLDPARAEAASQGSLLAFVRDHVQTYRDVAVVAVSNSAMRNMTLNMLLWMHRAGLDVRLPLIVCLDHEAHEFFARRGLTSYLATPALWTEIGWPLAPDEGKNFVGYGGGRSYGRLTRSKVAVVNYLVQQGVNVLYQDVDLVYLRRQPHALDAALAHLDLAPTDVVMSLNYPVCNLFEYNTGFYIARASPKSQLLMRQFVDACIADTNEGTDDQAILNSLERSDKAVKALLYPLPYDQFMPGGGALTMGHAQTPFAEVWRAGWPDKLERETRYPFIMHANFLIGANKIKRLREWNLWLADDEQLLRTAGLSEPSL